jgi:hypothetical protein
MQYTEDYDEQFVPSQNGYNYWAMLLAPYAQKIGGNGNGSGGDLNSYQHCPSDTTAVANSYALNGFVTEDPTHNPCPTCTDPPNTDLPPYFSVGLSLAQIDTPSDIVLAGDAAKIYFGTPGAGTASFAPSDYIRIENIQAVEGNANCVRTGDGVTDDCVNYVKQYNQVNIGEGCNIEISCGGFPSWSWAEKTPSYRHTRTATSGWADFVFIDGHAHAIQFGNLKTYNLIPNETDAQKLF